MEIGLGSLRPALTRVTVWVTAPLCKGGVGVRGFSRPAWGLLLTLMPGGRLAPRRSSFSFTLCVFARQFWFSVLQPLNLAHVMPSRSISSFAKWWRRLWKKIPKQLRKGFNSLCILGAWTLWKHMNTCVFDGGSPYLQQALQTFKDDFQLWQISGAKGLAALDSGRVLAQT